MTNAHSIVIYNLFHLSISRLNKFFFEKTNFVLKMRSCDRYKQLINFVLACAIV